MRILGVVTELRTEPGMYMRADVAAHEEVASVWKRALETDRALMATISGGSAMGGIALAAVSASLGTYGIVPTLVARLLQGYLRPPPPPIERVQGTEPSCSKTSYYLPSPSALIPAPLLGGRYEDYDAPVFHGLFESPGQLRNIVSAEGGNVDILIVDQRVANDAFRRVGNARFSTGLYLPHPKDPSVLVPVSDYANTLKEEVEQEWVRIMEALGARLVVLADSTTRAGKLVGHQQGIAAEMRATYGAGRVHESTYVAGTFDPDRAKHGRLWLGEHPEIMSIIEGRQHGHQASWRRTIRMNASFGVEARALKALGVAFDGKFERTYDFYVEFHPKGKGASMPDIGQDRA